MQPTTRAVTDCSYSFIENQMESYHKGRVGLLIPQYIHRRIGINTYSKRSHKFDRQNRHTTHDASLDLFQA